MELRIKERLYILQILPKEGSFSDFNQKRNILKKIAITEKETKTFSIVERPEENRIEWDQKKDAAQPLVVEFTNDELLYMKRACEGILETDAPYPDEFWATVEKIYNAIVA